jgi:hypothetical protein
VAFDQHSDVETAADSMTDAQSGQHAVIHSPSADDPPPAEPGAQAHVFRGWGGGGCIVLSRIPVFSRHAEAGGRGRAAFTG